MRRASITSFALLFPPPLLRWGNGKACKIKHVENEAPAATTPRGRETYFAFSSSSALPHAPRACSLVVQDTGSGYETWRRLGWCLRVKLAARAKVSGLGAGGWRTHTTKDFLCRPSCQSHLPRPGSRPGEGRCSRVPRRPSWKKKMGKAAVTYVHTHIHPSNPWSYVIFADSTNRYIDIKGSSCAQRWGGCRGC